MLQLQSITKIFKSDLFAQPFTALKDVSFEVPEGSLVGFLGANGSGKTTSLKIIMDFIRPTSGEVIYGPALGKTEKEAFKNIGFLPERPYFYQNLKGFEFLTFMGELTELSRSEIKNQVQYWAPRFRIDHALNRELRTYSKGMLQRIGFLAAILHQPKLIILDEPLSGLDPVGRKEIKDVIVEVHKSGKSVFFSSHIVPDIEAICDRVIFLNEGKLVYDGPVESLLQSNFQKGFILKVKSEKPLNFLTPVVQSIPLPENLTLYKVSPEHKDALIREVVTASATLVGLEPIQSSLEEIFYRTKAQ